MGTGEIRATAARLSASTEALAALGAALRLRAGGLEAPPAVQASLDEVLAALGLDEAVGSLTPDELSAALAPIRALLLQSVDFLTDPSRAPGWAYTDVELLEGLGQSSAGFARLVRDLLAPELTGLGDALERPGASFLDVGVGVGALAIAMCRLYPQLRAVGIDPWEAALDRARRNVDVAGLDGRIELRRQRAEELTDDAAFDLVFLAGPFLGADAVDPRVPARSRRSVRAAGRCSRCSAAPTRSRSRLRACAPRGREARCSTRPTPRVGSARPASRTSVPWPPSSASPPRSSSAGARRLR